MSLRKNVFPNFLLFSKFVKNSNRTRSLVEMVLLVNRKVRSLVGILNLATKTKK